MNDVASSHGVIRFGAFEVDLRGGEVRKHGLRIRLQGQPFHILQILLEHPGELVTREEIQRHVWPADTFVDFEKGLNNAIKKLRDALGDSAEKPRFIETQARRGYRFIGSVTATNGGGRKGLVDSTGELGAPARSRALYHPLVIGSVLVLTFVATLFGFDIARVRERWLTRASTTAIHSLAVIPLANLSNDPNQEYFSDGMTDALITDLAQIGSVKVASRTTSMQYKDTKKSLPEIARELNVDGIVEGTVQRSGDRVRITTNLIQAATDKQVWTRIYERDLRDVLTLEREVAGDIAHQVQAQMTSEKQAQLAQPQPANPKALDAYLRGKYYLTRAEWTVSEDEKQMAAQYFQQAIDADSNFVPAYIGLANAHLFPARGSRENTAITKRAAEGALELDPNSSEAWDILGLIEWRALDWAGAEQDFRRSAALSPNHDSSISVFLAATGRLDEALKEGQIHQELNPNEDNLSEVLEMRGEHNRAIELLQRMAVLHPTESGMHHGLFRNYAETGRYEEAVQELEKTLTLMGAPEIAADVHRGFAASGYPGAMREYAKALETFQAANNGFFPDVLAYAYLASGDKDRAFYWLEQAYEHRENVGLTWGLMIIKEDRLFDSIRSDPRFADLLRRVGLPP